MKIGIITYWNSKENYGQLLQCYALQRFLIKEHHEPFLIKYKNDYEPQKISPLSKFFSYIINFPAYVKYALHLYSNQRNRKYYDANSVELRNFNSFVERYIRSTETEYGRKDLYQNNLNAEAFICGSDQIWGSEDDIYYLSFVPEGKRIIAYAPSFGGSMSFSKQFLPKLKNYLSRFHFLGIREQSGVDYCQSLGFNEAVKVVDPTLLLDKNDYEVLRIKTNYTKPYVFLYLLGNPCACKVSEVFKFAEKHNLDVVYVASQDQNDAYKKVYPQIGEWIDLLAKSSFVITNSFHCTVFSLIYQRKVMAIPLIGAYKRMNTRIEELLACANLQSAVYRGNIDNVYSMEYDFSVFQNYREKETFKSKAYLTKVLQ